MNTIIVWYLITLGGDRGDEYNYSPPLPTLAACEQLIAQLPKPAWQHSKFLNCAQIPVVTELTKSINKNHE